MDAPRQQLICLLQARTKQLRARAIEWAEDPEPETEPEEIGCGSDLRLLAEHLPRSTSVKSRGKFIQSMIQAAYWIWADEERRKAWDRFIEGIS